MFARARLTCFPALLAMLVGVGSAGAAAPRPDPLLQEERLAQPLDLSAREEPLAELLARVARKTGAPLAATEDTADERITLFVRGRPVREVLARIAEHLDYTWVPETRAGISRLVLVQDLAAKSREKALRRARGQEIAALRKLVEEQVLLGESPGARGLAKKPREERLRRYDELDERLHGKFVLRQEGESSGLSRLLPVPLPPAEREVLQREMNLLSYLTPECASTFSIFPTAPALYALLPPEAREALWQGEPVRFAYPAEQERRPLAHSVATDLGHASLGTMAHRSDEVTGRDLRVPMNSVERVRAELQLEGRGIGARLTLRLRVLGSFGDRGDSTRTERVFSNELTSDFLRPAPPKGPLLDERSHALRDPVTLPVEKPPPGKEGSTRFVELLEKLSARVPYPIIADGYTTGELGGQLIADRKPLSEVLEKACKIWSRHCRYDGRYLTLRHSDWANRRAAEPPARRVRRWEKDLEAFGALPLSDLVEIAGRLTLEQVEMLQVRWRGQVPEGIYWSLENEMEQSRTMLRLLYGLPPGTWRSLQSGQKIPLRLLPPASRREARACLMEVRQFLGGGDDPPAPDAPPSMPGKGFEAEDRLEATWGLATLSLRRTPAAWFITHIGFMPVEQVAEALEWERQEDPKTTEKDLKRITGERVDVFLSVPETPPIGHFFLVPVTERPKKPVN